MCFSGLVTIFGNTRFLPIPFRLDISCSLFFGKLLLFIRFISLCNCIKCLFADTEWPFGVTERSFRVTERRFIMRRYNSYCRFAASFLRHENGKTYMWCHQESNWGHKANYSQCHWVNNNRIKKENVKLITFSFYKFGNLSDSGRIQTCNLLIRSQMLYSVELRSQTLVAIRCVS